MTRNETHAQDITTLANFKDTFQPVSNALAAFGWAQTADTGQVNWSTISSVPASNAYVYEIWKPGDALTPFYVRIDYGNNGGGPGLKLQCGTSTNGSGTLSGFTSAQRIPYGINANHGSVLYNCLFCGDVSSFGCILWRDGGNAAIFGFERSRDASGNATASYFTQYTGRGNSSASSATTQQSVVFGVGAAQECNVENGPGSFNVLYGPSSVYNGSQSMLFNGMVGASPCFPYVGYFDIPGLLWLGLNGNDYSELATVSLTMLGSTHSYIFTKTFSMRNGIAFAMRWE